MLATVAWAVCLAALSQTPEETPAPEAPAAEQPQPPADTPTPPAPKPKARATPRPAPQAASGDADATPKSNLLHLDLPTSPAGSEADLAKKAARAFFADLIEGDARRLVGEDCGLPFYVEDRKFSGGEELLQEWLKNLRDKRTDLLTLYGIEVLTPQEMERKYGKPPARLASVPWKSPHTMIAVANLSGHAAVAIVTPLPHGWKVVGYHD